MDKANSEENVTKTDRTTGLMQDSNLMNKRVIANGQNEAVETTTISNTAFSKKVQKSSRNIGKFCFTRSASSPAMLVESRPNLGVLSINRIKDSEIKGERNERKSGWKTERKHVSFDECVHVLTKCSVIKLPLKNSTRPETDSRGNDENCDEHTRSCLRKSGNLLTITKNVSFGLDETLRAAVLEHDVSEVERLCQQWDINFNKRLSNGLTLLHLSSIEGCFRVVQFILKHGGRVDEPDERGWTALHYAALHGNVPCALALLRGGADINSRTWDYRTAIELASEDEMILLLGRLMNGGLRKADKANQNKETYV